MEVIETNKEMRDKIIDVWDSIYFLYKNDFDTYFKRVEELFEIVKDCEDFEYIMGCLVSNAYVVDSFNKDEEDYECDENLFDINSLEDYISNCDYVEFDRLCDRCSAFNELTLGYKRKYYYETLKYKDELMDIFPCYLIDLLYYLNLYDKKELLYSYEEAYLELFDTQEDAANYSVAMYDLKLKTLSKQNKNSSLYIISDILTDCYRYLVYLKKVNKLDGIKAKILNDIELDIKEYENKMLNEDGNLCNLLELYLEYETLEKSERFKVDNYFDCDVNNNELKTYKKVFQTKDFYLTK